MNLKAKTEDESKLSSFKDGLSARLKKLEESYANRSEAVSAYGLQKGAYEKWVYARSSPSVEALAKIAQVAGVSLDWLAFGTDAPSAEQGPNVDRNLLQIDYLLMDKINAKYRELYAKMPPQYGVELVPAPYTMYFTYNRLILIEDEAERSRMLDAIIATHEHDIIVAEEARLKSSTETVEDKRQA